MRRVIIIMAAGLMITAFSTKANLSNNGFETNDRPSFASLESGPGRDIFTIMPPYLFAEGGWVLSLEVFFDSENPSSDLQDCFAGPPDSGNLSQTALDETSGSGAGDYGADGWSFNALTIPPIDLSSLEREIENVRDQNLYCPTTLDNIFFPCQGRNKPSIPAPDAIFLGGIGACLVSWLRRRRTL